MSRGFFMPESFEKASTTGTDGNDDVDVVGVQGGLYGFGSVSPVSKTNYERTDMNTMINPSNNELPQASREELLARIEEMLTSIEVLEAEVNGLQKTLKFADESLQSWRRQVSDTKANVESLAHEHLDLEGTEFFDAIIDLFDIELTKTVTVQYNVSFEVQATVPASMDSDEVIEELTNATLEYNFFGNGDIVIEDFTFGDMEAE